jgi:surface protein
MSARTVRFSGLEARRVATLATPASAPWVRDPSWLALPTVSDTEQKFVGLHAVWPEANFLALSAAAAYTVDWGDGAIENFAENEVAYHIYDFADADLADTNGPVTFQDTGDAVTRTAHGYSNGMAISFSAITTTTGIIAGQIYYVVNATANTFQLSATVGGAALALTGNGSGLILPYKQAIVTVTPQAGQDLTALNLNIKHNQAGLQAYTSGWLDVLVSSTKLSSLAISGSTINVRHRKLERAQLISANTIPSFAACFNACGGLRSIPKWVLGSSGDVSLNNMFNGCTSLQGVSLFNTSSVTNMSVMFSGCRSLTAIPLFDTSSVTDMSSMFSSCSSLQDVPLFDTSSVTTMANMFSTCSSLQAVPLFNTASVTNMSSMFSNCVSLQFVPLFDTSSVTTMANMFSICGSLTTVPLFNTSSVTNMSSMFSSCSSLTTVPLFDTAAVTNMSSMFGSCSSLTTIPLFNTAAVTNMSSMFSSCVSLQSVPALVVTAVTSGGFGAVFSGCSSLSRIQAQNFRFTFSLTNCKLSDAALNEIYTNLPTVSGQTISVSGNYGAATDNTAIAVAKGWTIAG